MRARACPWGGGGGGGGGGTREKKCGKTAEERGKNKVKLLSIGQRVLLIILHQRKCGEVRGLSRKGEISEGVRILIAVSWEFTSITAV